ERFGPADVLDAERTEYNCETCNVHNMLKLSHLLFSLTGDKKYADYDGWAYTNSILSSQNHETGMSTYFQPMASGFFKVYSTREQDFWCCTGTGMENFTKPWAGVAFADDGTLYLTRLVSCTVTLPGVNVSLETDWLNGDALTLHVAHCDRRIALRVPDWTDAASEGGWLYYDGAALDGRSVTLRFPRLLRSHSLPDAPQTRAYSFGPFLLSAGYATGTLRTDKTGVDVTVPTRDGDVREHLRAPELLPTGAPCRFMLRSADGWETELAPHFLKNQERYGIYFTVDDAAPQKE
nr:glycoside hydrolase family 127 protein [Oscillospiraceae bacterium]